MKVAFVSDFYSPSIGGTQMLCKNIAEYFFEKGHEINIITTFEAERELSKFPYKVIQLQDLNFKASNIFANNGYDHVFFLCDIFSSSYITVNLQQIKKKTIILNLDENVFRWIEQRQGGLTDERVEEIVNKIKEFTNVVSFCKEAPVNKFLDLYNIEYKFIPNFSRDVIQSKDITEKIKGIFPTDKKIIFNHGNIEQRKNQLALIEAFLGSSLTKDYRLFLLGSPRKKDVDAAVYMDKIVNLKKKLDKQNNVVLLKATNKLELIDSMLRLSDVFVLPSLAEGLPLVLLEAMSAGLPWVSTPCGGVPGVMSNFKSGEVLESFKITPESLENSIKKVEGKNSRKDWENNFTREICCEKYLELL